MHGPLSDIRVIDLTQVLSGPYCTMLLADMGADVIKVEPPSGDVARAWGPHPSGPDSPTSGGYGGYFASTNRNKRSVVIDLRSEQGLSDLHHLLEGADVLVENFRVGVMDRFGLGYETLKERYPRLVYASIRGFGDPRTGESPYAQWPAFDIIAQSMGGILGITGIDPDNPVKVGPGVGDIFPAALAACGILAAVHQADRTGHGDFVDVAMYDAVLSLSERIVYQHSINGEGPRAQGNTHPILCPYGLSRTSDGFVAIATPTDHHWQRLCAVMDRQDISDDQRLVTNDGRLANAPEVYALVEEWTSQLPTAEVISRLDGEVPCAPVQYAEQIAADPHVAARHMIKTVEHPSGSPIDIAGAPIKFGHGDDQDFTRAPLLGEHNTELLPPRP